LTYPGNIIWHKLQKRTGVEIRVGKQQQNHAQTDQQAKKHTGITKNGYVGRWRKELA
jgi:phage-related protein